MRSTTAVRWRRDDAAGKCWGLGSGPSNSSSQLNCQRVEDCNVPRMEKTIRAGGASALMLAAGTVLMRSGYA